MILRRHRHNPILVRADIPAVPGKLEDPSSVFNPGAIRHGDAIRLLLRVQSRGRETFLFGAHSRDGVSFRVDPRPVELEGIERLRGRLHHIYDPRLTRIDGLCYAMVALDIDDGCRLGLAVTSDFRRFEFLGVVSDTDARNGVLFPERVGGRYLRLERPNLPAAAGRTASGSEIVLASSDDLLRWRREATVARGRARSWDERIGSGPPPVKTRHGWLHMYHGVATHFAAASIYQAGVLLLDLDDPSRLVGRSRTNVLEPRMRYEQVGQLPNVVFPSGWVVDRIDPDGFAADTGRVLLYYGAADTCVALARSTVGELVAACEAVR